MTTPGYKDVSVISTLALKGALEAAAPGLNAQFHATQALLPLIADGLTADVVILTNEGIDQLDALGKLEPGTKLVLGHSGVGLAVKAGAPKPKIGSVEELKQALLSASSVGHSAQGASGLYFAGLLDRLGIANQLKKRVVVERGPVAVQIASGDIELGAQMLCELAPVPGIEIVGPLPDEVQAHYSFAAAAMKGAANPQAGQAFMEFLRSQPAREAMQKNLFEPSF